MLLHKGPKSENSDSCVSEKSLFEKNRLLVHPNLASKSPDTKSATRSQDSSDISPNAAFLNVNNQFSLNTNANASQSSHMSTLILPKRYKWYPNLGIESPKNYRFSISPSPKQMAAAGMLRRQSAAVPNGGFSLKPLATGAHGDAQGFAARLDNYNKQKVPPPAVHPNCLTPMEIEECKNISPFKCAQMSKQGKEHFAKGSKADAAKIQQMRRKTVLD